MKNQTIILFLTILFCTFYSCKRDEPESTLLLPDQIMQDYTMFGVGSYWLYKDSLTGAIDSLNMTSIDTLIGEFQHSRDKWTHITYHLYSSVNNHITYEIQTIFFPTNAFCDRGNLKFVNAFELGPCFGGIEYTAYYDSVWVNGLRYDYVMEFSYTNDNDKYMFAKRVGLIKEVSNGKTIELVSYHVN